MSLTVFENHNLDFKVSLIKMRRKLVGELVKDVVEEAIDLNNASVLDLQITESSLTLGAKGIITIGNKFDILERLQVSTNSPDDLYVAIEINDIELNEANLPDEHKTLTLIALVSNTVPGSNGPVENILTFTFEEAFIAAMKLTQVQYFFGKGADIGLGDILNNTNAVEFAEVYNNKVYKLRSEDNIIASDNTPNTRHTILIQDKHECSAYDALKKMIDESGVGSDVGKVPYMRLTNVIGADGLVKRRFKYEPFMSDRHVAFVNAIKRGETTGNYSDIFLEKFFLGPFADAAASDPNALMTNKIEEYNITRADVTALRQTTWGDYNISNATAAVDPGLMSSEHKSFFDLQSEFFERELGGEDIEANLPIVDGKELRDFHFTVNTLSDENTAQDSITQIKQKIANNVYKSFYTLNESISFVVKGQVYRQPNKFIWIDRGEAEEDYKKLWYVNSVTHKFSEGKYRTKIVATKIFGDTSASAIESNK